MHVEGQHIHGVERHGEILLAAAEIMFEATAVVFEEIEALVLDFPPRSGAGDNLDWSLPCGGDDEKPPAGFDGGLQ